MKNGGKIVAAVLVVLVIFGSIKVKQYYDDRYVGSDYYTRVPADQSTDPEPLYDDSGKEVDTGKEYALVSYNEKGEKRVLEFSYRTEDSSKLLQPVQYVKVSASKQIVVGQEVVKESDVPESVLKYLK
ncbi:YxeA family protein [Erysipelothrix inopinata]|uniref:YxeA family protein n=1 Tax=Erysipelothrix inopinata TaxID=225084 RepID=A0A7G9RZH3_9FIRM|nr:YxeA family protein [Erysipelothrix inopinata]QNN60998.1 YxeA family protein [Erysipelothrix inopinata]